MALVKIQDASQKMYNTWKFINSPLEEWKSFDKFKAWSLKNGYREGLMFSRKDRTKGHTLENCEWTTIEKNGSRNPTCLPITYKGKTQNLHQWAKELGLNYVTLFSRLKRGWSLKEAFTSTKFKPKK